jgi:hypothetical protein
VCFALFWAQDDDEETPRIFEKQKVKIEGKKYAICRKERFWNFNMKKMTLDMQCSIFFESVPKRKETLMLHNYF